MIGQPLSHSAACRPGLQSESRAISYKAVAQLSETCADAQLTIGTIARVVTSNQYPRLPPPRFRHGEEWKLHNGLATLVFPKVYMIVTMRDRSVVLKSAFSFTLGVCVGSGKSGIGIFGIYPICVGQLLPISGCK